MKYLHCSFAGSYLIDCDILDVKQDFSPPLSSVEKTLKFMEKPKGTYYLIKYLDPNIEELVEKWVEKSYMISE